MYLFTHMPFMHHIGFPCLFSAKAYSFGKLLCATCFIFSLNSTLGQEQVELTSKVVCLTFFPVLIL